MSVSLLALGQHGCRGDLAKCDRTLSNKPRSLQFIERFISRRFNANLAESVSAKSQSFIRYGNSCVSRTLSMSDQLSHYMTQTPGL